MTRYQDLMAKHYNTKVRPRHFQVGDLVLRKVTMTTRDPSQGKLGPNWESPTRLSIAIERGPTTWKPSTDKGSITSGTSRT